MKHDFTPWLDSLTLGRLTREITRERFVRIFKCLHEFGFELLNPSAIEGGYRLEFRFNKESWVIVDRYTNFPVGGERPGIALYNDSDEHEMLFSISSSTPMDLVCKAIAILTADEDE